MSMIKKTISITDRQNDWIQSQIMQGHYQNESEMIQALIRDRLIQEQEKPADIEAIRAALEEGEKSGNSLRNVDDIMQNIIDQRQRYAQL